MRFLSVRFLFVAVLFSTLLHAQEATKLVGPYLGQKPPGSKPEPFAPGIVSTELFDAFGVFSPKQDAFYFIRYWKEEKKHRLITFEQKDGRWYKNTLDGPIGELHWTPDGKRLYLGSSYSDRTEDGWSKKVKLGEPFAPHRIMRLTTTTDGTAYFDERTEKGTIRVARPANGKYSTAEPLDKVVNSGMWTAHPFIAPDESYLIWDSERPEGYGGPDLYIRFRLKDGSWGPAQNLGPEINSDTDDAYGTITPDGKYMFFYRSMGPANLDIYWVDAGFIERMRPR